jgi:hypothetical protein
MSQAFNTLRHWKHTARSGDLGGHNGVYSKRTRFWFREAEKRLHFVIKISPRANYTEVNTFLVAIFTVQTPKINNLELNLLSDYRDLQRNGTARHSVVVSSLVFYSGSSVFETVQRQVRLKHILQRYIRP